MIPNLIHPCDVKIKQILKSSTIMDEDAREPVQQAKRAATKTVPGQPKWGQQYGLGAGKAGAVEGSDGYVLFRKIDLDAASVTLQPNDRFVQIGHVMTDVYIIKLEWCGHYQDQSGPTMVKAHFADRQPSKQTRGV